MAVGYQTYTLEKGVNVLTVVFDAMANQSAFDLVDLKLQNAAGDGTESISILDSNGINIGDYFWYTVDGTGEMVDTDGWYKDDELVTANQKTVKPGEGLYIKKDNDESNVSLLSSGNVCKSTREITLVPGVNITGNATPVSWYLQQMKLQHASGDGTESISILDSNGINIGDYFWYTVEGTGEMVDTDGWYKDDELVGENDVLIQPGRGLYIKKDAETSNTKLILPSAFNEQ